MATDSDQNQGSNQDQQHPQWSRDRQIINTLLSSEATDYNLAELARLKIRYHNFPGARDIQRDLEKITQKWGYTEDSLFEKTRTIHALGEVYKGRGSKREDWS